MAGTAVVAAVPVLQAAVTESAVALGTTPAAAVAARKPVLPTAHTPHPTPIPHPPPALPQQT